MSSVVAGVPLRIRLVAALTALVALALAVSGFAATTALHGYLLDRVDANLVEVSQQRPGPRGGAVVGPGDGDEVGRIRRPGEYAIQVYAASGAVTRAFSQGTSSPPQLSASQVKAPLGQPFTVGSVQGGDQWRVVTARVGQAGTLVVAVSLDEVGRTLARLVLVEVVIGLLVLVGLALLGYAIVRSSLRPLVEVEETAERIAAGDLAQRVPEADPRTEVGRLAGSLNGMLGQVERAFRAQQDSEVAARQSEERMRRFVADASHELRTPLTSIRGFAELYRQGAVAGGADLDRVMRRVEDEAARMGLLVDDLLLLARLDQQRPLVREPVDLLVLVGDAVHDASAVAPDREVRLETSGEPPVVLGDDPRLRQVVGNLISNALTHTPAGSAVTVRLQVRPQTSLAVIEVADSGPGLTQEQAARVFERFYRADAARTRATGGSGLGLSIVAALVAAHGGQVEVDPGAGSGATFRVLLPLAFSSYDAASPV